MTGISLRGISMTYPGQERPALDSVDLDIEGGRITALLGPSGCGKTTLLKIVAGLLHPTKGDILISGASMLDVAPERRDTVMVYQDNLLFPHMDVASNVGFGLRMRKVPQDEIASKVSETLEMVHLEGVEGRMPSELSGGQQQRVALARALVVDPKVLLLDEPLSNLDAHLRLEMRDLIHSLQRSTGVTCVFVTHDQEEAVVMADKVALVFDGSIVQYAVPSDFYERPASTRVAKFFGAQNFLGGVRDGRSFKCDVGDLPLAYDSGTGPATATVRPENLQVATSSKPGSLRGTVVSAVYMGVSCRLLVNVNGSPGAKLTVLTYASAFHDLAEGNTVWLDIPPERLWIMSNDSKSDDAPR